MAEEKEKKDNTKAKEPAGEKSASPSGSKKGIIGWLILASVVVAGSTGGFALSQLLGGSDPVSATTAEVQAEEQDPTESFLNDKGEGGESWPFDQIEPVVANLDEPGVTRYIRATVTFEMSGEVDQEKMRPYLMDKNPIIKDWLTTYFAGLSLEDVRGSRNLSRIKQEIKDQLNEQLFADGGRFIERVLFKEFAVQ